MKIEIYGTGRSIHTIPLDTNTLDKLFSEKSIPETLLAEADWTTIASGYQSSADVFCDGKYLGTISDIVKAHGSHRPDLLDSLYIIPSENSIDNGIVNYSFDEGVLFRNNIDEPTTPEGFIVELINSLVFDDRIGVYYFRSDSFLLDGSGAITQDESFIRFILKNRQYSLSIH